MSTITSDYRHTSIYHSPEILTGLNAAVYKCAGRFRRKTTVLTMLSKHASMITKETSLYKDCSDRSLREKLNDFKIVFRRRDPNCKDCLFSALSAIAESAYRTLGMRPFHVQLTGALALYNNYIAEMATGEGKTLTASLTAILHGWSGFPCHIITANDYLAERDAEKLNPLYTYCGVSVGSVTSAMERPLRRSGYKQDITYSTAKEVTADFLRDRIALGDLQKFEHRIIRNLLDSSATKRESIVTRGLHTAIIDEADSLLIDEAVTPLIISQQQPNEVFSNACKTASILAATLEPGKHYIINKQYREIEILPEVDLGEVCKSSAIPHQFSGRGFQRELILQALTAREFYHKDKQYIIQDDKIVIVDEFTGRTMAQRSWSEGLHQMVEAKENLPITPPNETLARLSFQRYFRFYRNLSGMTGTAFEAADELWHVYSLPVVQIPSNKPCKRIMLERKFYPDQTTKWNDIVNEIIEIHTTGRPVLIGTRSVQSSEMLAGKLSQKGYDCKVINAVRHRDEAAIVSRAGERGAITVATNMAGRGTDILIPRDIEKKGGLHVIATELNESYRIDRQLFGRAARQGDNGSARSFVSMDDEVLKQYVFPFFLQTVTKAITANAPFSKLMANKAVKQAQNNARERAYKSRRSVQKMDTWLKDSLTFSHSEY
ncbi:MAG: hypothetical protein JW915_23525 [Chitinispirillaceae bacterium]|nr:hypothetical protein [Chitinispirillaceae bacterium]